MNIDEMILQLRTSEELLEKLRKAAGKDMTEEERHKQMLSYVAGNIDDEDITYEKIEEMIAMLKQGKCTP